MVNTLTVRRLATVTLALALPGCSPTASGTISLVTGGEDAAATLVGVSELSVAWVDSDAGVHSLATAKLPAGTIDLGSLDVNTVGQLEVKGLDDAGVPVVFGSTIPVQFGLLDGVTLPVFIQRTGALARLPSPPIDTRTFPLLSVLGGRYLVVAGGDFSADAGTSGTLGASTQLYDFASLSPLPSPPSVSVAPESMAIVNPSNTGNTVAYLIDESNITAFDFSDNDAGVLPPPSGAAPADVAGGVTITGGSDQYVVGPTRTIDAPTDTVLKIGSDGSLSWLKLTAPRWGAAAAWVDGRGLVIAGGSASAAGVELLSAAGAATPLVQYPADPAVSAGAATLDDMNLVLLAGGQMLDGSDPGVRLIDLSCAQTLCAPTAWAPLPMPLAWAQVFRASRPTTAIAVGSELYTQRTHVFALTSASADEVPTHAAHSGARAVSSPLGPQGSFWLFGGAPEIESFVPLP